MSSEPSTVESLPPEWSRFLDEVDGVISRAVELHCLGGFVLTTRYGAPRRTGDLDCLAVVPLDESAHLEEIVGRGSTLARKHRLYIQLVTVADLPENYEERLTEIFRGRFRHLHLIALDPYDLALSKLTRNYPIDREDIRLLARAVPLDPDILHDRYARELRPNLPSVERHDLTLQLWVEGFFPK